MINPLAQAYWNLPIYMPPLPDPPREKKDGQIDQAPKPQK